LKKLEKQGDYINMAKSYLTPEELQAGNKWLKTVFFPCVKQGASEYIAASSWEKSDVVQSCKKIYQFIVDRKIDTQGDLTQNFNTLGSVSYFNTPDFDYNDSYKIKSRTFVKVFANICAKREIFWDDAEYTPHELDYFKKTVFGEALWDFRCFVSQEPDVRKVPTASPAASTTRTTTGNGSTTSAAPKAPRATGAGHTLYRNNAGGIVGTSKDILTVPEMYCILGEFNPKGKTSPKIHVSPQGQGAPLRVKYTSGQGHNDCILYFDSLAAANDFKTKCDANLPANVAFLKVKKLATDPNGYVQVDTQYGPAWIKASKLHEEIVEDEADVELVEEVVTEEVEQLPESYYREEYAKAAFALNELLD
jgi:hypothetical protein